MGFKIGIGLSLTHGKGAGGPFFNAGGDLTKFKAARGTGNRIIALVGDSTIAGQDSRASDVPNKTGTAYNGRNAPSCKLAANLRANGYNASGDNLFGDHYEYGGTQTIAGLIARDDRLSYSGSIITTGLIIGGRHTSMTAAATFGFSNVDPGNTVDVWWRDGVLGRIFSVAIDGGAAVEVPSIQVGGMKKTNFSLGSLGLHAIVDNWVSGAPQPAGWSVYDDSSWGYQVFNLEASGWTSADCSNNTDTTTGPQASLKTLAPVLTLIEGGIINDWRNSVAIATTKTNLQAIIDAASISGSVVLLVPPFDAGTAGASAQQDQYVAAMYELAVSNNIPLIDVRRSWGTWAAANALGYCSDSTVHLTDVGNAAWAALIGQFIRGAVAP
jgi:hypothetical protein